MARDGVAFYEGCCGEHSRPRLACYVGCIGKRSSLVLSTISFGIDDDNPWYCRR